MPAPAERQLILYTRPGCHLCEAAKEELRRHFPALAVEEVNVDLDPLLRTRWGEEVPVGFLEGTKVFKFYLDARRLRRLLGGRRWGLF